MSIYAVEQFLAGHRVLYAAPTADQLDMFWRHMIRLSREDGVTLFVSTHFMNEAQRCDRISLMHRGRVLAVVGTGADLTAARAATYATVASVRLPGSHFRSDIALAAERGEIAV